MLTDVGMARLLATAGVLENPSHGGLVVGASSVYGARAACHTRPGSPHERNAERCRLARPDADADGIDGATVAPCTLDGCAGLEELEPRGGCRGMAWCVADAGRAGDVAEGEEVRSLLRAAGRRPASLAAAAAGSRTDGGAAARVGAWADAGRGPRRCWRGGIGIRGDTWGESEDDESPSLSLWTLWCAPPNWEGGLPDGGGGWGRPVGVRSVRDGGLAAGLGAGHARSDGAEEEQEAVQPRGDSRAGGRSFEEEALFAFCVSSPLLASSHAAVPRASGGFSAVPRRPASQRPPRRRRRPAGRGRRRAHRDVGVGTGTRTRTRTRMVRSAIS
ncbi:hypothetical protein C8T65DRAFT_238342 [Cerioporus squamosus]|nr:hypothetical protein C8T65DRAFT_238342 [Cerioporus squamosus]